MNLLFKIEEAAKLINPYIVQTPLEKSIYLSNLLNANVYLKNEHCQYTGSFKIRGALNKILQLPESIRSQGVICASAGNHGIGVATAGQITQTPVTVFLPNSVDKMRLDKIKSLGAKTTLIDGDCGLAESLAMQAAQQNNQTYVSPYNDEEVIAGQGTIGLEIINRLNRLDEIYISVGGGGLISGIGCVLKQQNPSTQIIGCCPENSPVMAESVIQGKIVKDKNLESLSDSTAGDIDPNTITLPLCQEYVNHFIQVSEMDIMQAMKALAKEEGWMVEGAAAMALAAALNNRHAIQGKTLVILLCGRNISFERYQDVIQSL